MDEKTPKQPMQVCSIRIGFPIESDDQALAYKKELNGVFANLPAARIEFSLLTIPAGSQNVPPLP